MSGDTKRVLEVNQIDNLQGSTQRVKQETTLNNLRGITQRVYVVGGGTPVIDELNVTPSTSAQTITAPEGVDGYSPVNVSAVTSAIDANITAGNIKKDVEILGVTGSYEGQIPTGTMYIISNGTYNVADKAIANVNVPTTAPDYYIEKYNDNGTLKNAFTINTLTGITAIGDYALSNSCRASSYSGNVPDLSNIVSIGTSGLNNFFYGSLSVGGTVNLSSLTSMGNYGLGYAFSGTAITSIDLSALTTCPDYGMQYMAQNCTFLTSVDLSNLTTVNQYGMQYAFNGCTGLTGKIDLSKVNNPLGNYAFSGAFSGCSNITEVDMSGVYYFNGQHSFDNAFINCSSLTKFDGSGSIYVSSFGSAFKSCSSLTDVDFSSVQLISTQGFNSGTDGGFNNCTSLKNITFHSCVGIQASAFKYAFKNCTALETVSFPALPDDFYANVNCFDNMLSGCSGVTVHFPSNLQSVIGSWTSVQNGFGGTNTTILFDQPATHTQVFVGANGRSYTRKSSILMFYNDEPQYQVLYSGTTYYTKADAQVGDGIYSNSSFADYSFITSIVSIS